MKCIYGAAQRKSLKKIKMISVNLIFQGLWFNSRADGKISKYMNCVYIYVFFFFIFLD